MVAARERNQDLRWTQLVNPLSGPNSQLSSQLTRGHACETPQMKDAPAVAEVRFQPCFRLTIKVRQDVAASPRRIASLGNY